MTIVKEQLTIHKTTYTDLVNFDSVWSICGMYGSE